MFGYMWRLALRESNASLEVHSANLSHILVEIWETLFEIQNITLSIRFSIDLNSKLTFAVTRHSAAGTRGICEDKNGEISMKQEHKF